MKLLIENWKKFLKEVKFQYNIQPTDKVFISPKKYTSFKNTIQGKFPTQKPNGLWYSCGDEWIQFGFNLGKAKYLYKIELDYSKILQINEKNVKQFEKKYSAMLPSTKFKMIDWKKVSEEYSGIEICPFMQDIHNDAYGHMWYYGWDVASGCIWNENCIKSVSLLESLEKK